ncbi:MAG: hypothetical protein HUK05_03360, partial [Prevotella sp.]|nr:hypothetical protein [Prevotella sp.]
MINLRNLCFSLLISTLSLCASDVLAENIVLHTPGNFQVLSVSPNGKWACGIFIDATNSTNPFRWNLESGSIDILGTSYGTAWDVANDGTVSGDYPDTRAAENGAATQLPCYWRGLTRYPIELPAGTLSDGVGCGISTDGRFMSGSICCDGIYTPFIWNEGKLYRSLNTGNHAIAFCISPDGQAAAGYDALYNRVACYWPADGGIVHFKDSKTHYQGPWNYSRNFSPNGKKLVYWGGWELADDNETLYLYSIYDTETGERKKVVAPDINASLEFYDVSNNELLVGTAGGRGYVDMAGKGMYVDEYLQLRGIDLRTLCDDMYAG